ncbi:Ger(x)C family spore germination protein [Lentibacillus sp. CBA3610]|uniref:Ger(x)C family spore germination protein n=1 Tax=Lentibacillus sp. CBA3610 TaxID=2518176 RepID=UPI001595DA2A|nr:Ger(x)C family spore germination protein [Lentibacillus sp. CBA3610]QKY69364.1 Ger(x)C family spore germination protein [Lentibacillus sp. CBA3610]
MFRILSCILFLCLLTGCWNSQELNDSALVHGVGLDKGSNGKIKFSTEIIKPGESSGGEGGTTGESIILEYEADTLIEGARESIRGIKRRVYFDHNRIWVISEELAKEDFIGYLDLSRRDQMFRLNSYIFITEGDPIDILETPTLYEDLSSTEIVSALDQTQYVAGYTPVKLYDLFRLMEGPIPNAYIPIIHTKEVNEQVITSLGGTAVINNRRMIGKLNNEESVGLNVLLDRATGGYVDVEVNGDKVSVEINNSKTELKPTLQGNKLKAHIEVTIDGTLADNTSKNPVNEQWLNQVQEEVNKKTKRQIHSTLDTLQQELKTDITGIGMETYRKYPEKWKHVQDQWNDIFTKAEISVKVNTDINHQGLINKSMERHNERPHNNPYKFK